MALITAAQFREHYPALSGTAEDTLLDTLIARADEALARACGYPQTDAGAWTLEDATYTFYLPAPSCSEPRRIELPVCPVVSITSAYSDPNEDYGAETQIASGDMVLDSQRGDIWLTPDATLSWSLGGRSNKVTVVAGYATTPPGLVAICAMQVRHLWNLRNTQGRESAQQQPDALAAIPSLVEQMLGPYRIWRAAAA